jgi:Fe-S-cluster containining protein
MKSDEYITGQIVLAVKGIPIQLELTVPVKPVKLGRMLPVFQKLTNAFVDKSVEGVTAAGEKVSCKSGCAACCYHPIPVSEVELYRISGLVENMPEPRRSDLKKRFSDAMVLFRSLGWFDRIIEIKTRAASPDMETTRKELILEAALDYFYQGIACPFLEDNSCSIYESRPLVCREYLVTSPAKNCSNPSAETINKVPIMIQASKTSERMSHTKAFTDLGVVPLIRALEFAEEFPENFPEKTGPEWTREFIKRLTNKDIPEPPGTPRQKKISKKKRKK